MQQQESSSTTKWPGLQLNNGTGRTTNDLVAALVAQGLIGVTTPSDIHSSTVASATGNNNNNNNNHQHQRSAAGLASVNHQSEELQGILDAAAGTGGLGGGNGETWRSDLTGTNSNNNSEETDESVVVKNNGSHTHSGINLAAYCNICRKDFCSKYFLRIHKQRQHGINPPVDDNLRGNKRSYAFSSNTMNSNDDSNHQQNYKNNNNFLLPGSLNASNGGLLGVGAGSSSSSSSVIQSLFQQDLRFNQHTGGSAAYEPASKRPVEENAIVQNDGSSQASVIQFNPGKAAAVAADSQGFKMNAKDLVDDQGKNDGQQEPSSFEGTTVNCHICNEPFSNYFLYFSHQYQEHGDVNPLLGTPGLHLPAPAHPAASQPDTPLNKNTGNSEAADSEAFCDICQKQYCNKYFLRKHKQKAHGISGTDGVPARGSGVSMAAAMGVISPLPKRTNSNLSLLMAEPMNNQRATSVINSTEQKNQDKTRNPRDKKLCDICNKELCNKYFLRTHMLKAHGIVIDENKAVIGKINTIIAEKTGMLVFRCQLCYQQMGSREELKVHKQERHGILPHSVALPGVSPLNEFAASVNPLALFTMSGLGLEQRLKAASLSQQLTSSTIPQSERSISNMTAQPSFSNAASAFLPPQEVASICPFCHSRCRSIEDLHHHLLTRECTQIPLQTQRRDIHQSENSGAFSKSKKSESPENSQENNHSNTSSSDGGYVSSNNNKGGSEGVFNATNNGDGDVFSAIINGDGVVQAEQESKACRKSVAEDNEDGEIQREASINHQNIIPSVGMDTREIAAAADPLIYHQHDQQSKLPQQQPDKEKEFSKTEKEAEKDDEQLNDRETIGREVRSMNNGGQIMVANKEVKPYFCSICPRSYSNLDRLERHKKCHKLTLKNVARLTKYGGISWGDKRVGSSPKKSFKRYRCRQCGKVFKSRESHRSHRFAVHLRRRAAEFYYGSSPSLSGTTINGLEMMMNNNGGYGKQEAIIAWAEPLSFLGVGGSDDGGEYEGQSTHSNGNRQHQHQHQQGSETIRFADHINNGDVNLAPTSNGRKQPPYIMQVFKVENCWKNDQPAMDLLENMTMYLPVMRKQEEPLEIKLKVTPCSPPQRSQIKSL